MVRYDGNTRDEEEKRENKTETKERYETIRKRKKHGGRKLKRRLLKGSTKCMYKRVIIYKSVMEVSLVVGNK